MEKYNFYQEEECEFTNLEIGGLCCLNCKQFKGIDYDEEWIKCIPYSAIQENETLKKENNTRFNYIVKLTKEKENLQIQVEQLENENASLKGGL